MVLIQNFSKNIIQNLSIKDHSNNGINKITLKNSRIKLIENNNLNNNQNSLITNDILIKIGINIEPSTTKYEILPIEIPDNSTKYSLTPKEGFNQIFLDNFQIDNFFYIFFNDYGLHILTIENKQITNSVWIKLNLGNILNKIDEKFINQFNLIEEMQNNFTKYTNISDYYFSIKNTLYFFIKDIESQIKENLELSYYKKIFEKIDNQNKHTNIIVSGNILEYLELDLLSIVINNIFPINNIKRLLIDTYSLNYLSLISKKCENIISPILEKNIKDIYHLSYKNPSLFCYADLLKTEFKNENELLLLEYNIDNDDKKQLLTQFITENIIEEIDFNKSSSKHNNNIYNTENVKFNSEILNKNNFINNESQTKIDKNYTMDNDLEYNYKISIIDTKNIEKKTLIFEGQAKKFFIDTQKNSFQINYFDISLYTRIKKFLSIKSISDTNN